MVWTRWLIRGLEEVAAFVGVGVEGREEECWFGWGLMFAVVGDVSGLAESLLSLAAAAAVSLSLSLSLAMVRCVAELKEPSTLLNLPLASVKAPSDGLHFDNEAILVRSSTSV